MPGIITIMKHIMHIIMILWHTVVWYHFLQRTLMNTCDCLRWMTPTLIASRRTASKQRLRSATRSRRRQSRSYSGSWRCTPADCVSWRRRVFCTPVVVGKLIARLAPSSRMLAKASGSYLHFHIHYLKKQ